MGARRVVQLLLALALVAAACGDASDEPVAGQGGSTTAAETASAGDGQPSSGGTLRYAYPIGPSRFDAHRSTVGQDIRLFAPVYDRLVHYDESGTFIPGLATDWSFSDDGMQLRMELRQGVTFHDGAPFDAEAVKANLERAKSIEGSSVAADLEDVTSVEVVDEHTVILHLDEPSAVLPGLLSSRAGIMISPEAFDDPDLDFEPVGAGPYRVTEYRVDDAIVYERFPDHWDTDAGGPDRIEVRILADETTRLNALRAGEVDVALLAGSQLQEAEMAGLRTDSSLGLTYQVLYLNRTKSHFGNLLVRQALQHAIDRQAFVDAVLAGAGEPAVQPFPEGYFAHNPDYPGDHFEYDPDKARALLAEAGVPDGFSFEMLVPSLSTFVLGAEVLQQMLGEVGITLTLRQIEPAAAGDIFFAQQDGEGMISQRGSGPDPQITMNLQFSQTGFLNAGGHTTPRFEELNAAAKAAIDPEERVGRLRDMVGEIVDQAFTVILAHDYMNHGYTDAVQGFGVLVGGEMNLREMAVAG